jgi:hypothetical protein
MPVELMSAIDEANATSSSANRLVAEEDTLLVAALKPPSSWQRNWARRTLLTVNRQI